MIIIGEKEATEGTISVRDRATDQTGVYLVEDFIKKLHEEIRNHFRPDESRIHHA